MVSRRCPAPRKTGPKQAPSPLVAARESSVLVSVVGSTLEALFPKEHGPDRSPPSSPPKCEVGTSLFLDHGYSEGSPLPAAGQSGRHVIEVVYSDFTFPYHNMQQSSAARSRRMFFANSSVCPLTAGMTMGICPPMRSLTRGMVEAVVGTDQLSRVKSRLR